MKRSGFARKVPATSQATQMTDYPPRARATVAATDGRDRAVVSAQKFPYVRDTRLRDMCRALPCQCCGRADTDAAVTWAHSNWSAHGKGKGIKASDIFVAALCWVCHARLDQGGGMTGAGKRAMWDQAHAKTVAEAIRLGLWPAGVSAPS